MREIRFRAIHKLTKHWFEDTKIVYEDGKWFEDGRAHEDYRPMNLEQVAVMQYTGIKDKNGVEIYEGDVVKGSYYAGYNIGIKRIIGNVSWSSASFKVNGVKQYEGIRVGLDGSFEVIGNIYENPELLGDSQ